jgi:hypothetical protein
MDLGRRGFRRPEDRLRLSAIAIGQYLKFEPGRQAWGSMAGFLPRASKELWAGPTEKRRVPDSGATEWMERRKKYRSSAHHQARGRGELEFGRAGRLTRRSQAT